MQIVLSPKANQTLDTYFENYVGYQSKNDMNKRAYNYSRILKCLSQINIMETYVIDGSNFVDVDDICKVEYKIERNDKEIVIKNIYFNNGGDVNEDIRPIIDLYRLLNVKV